MLSMTPTLQPIPVSVRKVLTVPSLNKELMKIDSFIGDKGFDIHLRQPPGWSGIEKGDHRVPLGYNWCMDYGSNTS